MINKITVPASFAFQYHKIRKVSFTEPINDQSNISIEFDPKGVYETSSSMFILTVCVTARYGEKDDKLLAEIIADGYFKFEDNTPFSEIPDFFYTNSIAILFPYIRAFITTLTSVANVKPLVLPTLNLSSLSTPLKENTVSK